jgi:hypothetical protein
VSARAPTAAGLTLGVFAALVAAVGAWVGLDALAKPPHFAEREAAVHGALERASHLNRLARGGGAYSEHAVCSGLGGAESASITKAIAASAAQAGVTIADLVASPPPPGRESSAIAPVALRLQASGPYEAVSGWIDRMARAEPQIFVDTLDLVSRSPNVSLKLTGKVFCWTSPAQS